MIFRFEFHTSINLISSSITMISKKHEDFYHDWIVSTLGFAIQTDMIAQKYEYLAE